MSSSPPSSCRHWKVLPLTTSSFGAEIVGLNLSSIPKNGDNFSLSKYCQSYVFDLWKNHSVLLIRHHHLTDNDYENDDSTKKIEEALLHFAKSVLGKPRPAGSRGYYMRNGGMPHGSGRMSSLPEVSVMSNMDSQTGLPMSVTRGHGSQYVDWHQDDSYTNTPARGALLYNTIHPKPNPYPSGNTSFCDLYAAYRTLPDDIVIEIEGVATNSVANSSKIEVTISKSELENLHLVHDISRNSAYHVRPGLSLPLTYDAVVGPAHPLVITHPITGRKALHLGRNPPPPSSYILETLQSIRKKSSTANSNEIRGIETAEEVVARHALFQYLWKHSIQPSNTWTHTTWKPGDLLIWDNLATMHARSSVDAAQKREMLRILLRGPSNGLMGVKVPIPKNGTQEQLHTIRTTANDKADAEAAEKTAAAVYVNEKNETIEDNFAQPNSTPDASPVFPERNVENLFMKEKQDDRRQRIATATMATITMMEESATNLKYLNTTTNAVSTCPNSENLTAYMTAVAMTATKTTGNAVVNVLTATRNTSSFESNHNTKVLNHKDEFIVSDTAVIAEMIGYDRCIFFPLVGGVALIFWVFFQKVLRKKKNSLFSVSVDTRHKSTSFFSDSKTPLLATKDLCQSIPTLSLVSIMLWKKMKTKYHSLCHHQQETREPIRIQVFWFCFLLIYLNFQSFSCGRADRLWRISDIYKEAPKVLLKPYGISSFGRMYEMGIPYLRTIENFVLVEMILLALFQPALSQLVRRALSFCCGLGWLILHGYEHSMTGGSHTHLMPAICMIALGLLPSNDHHNYSLFDGQNSCASSRTIMIRWWNMFLLFSAGISKLYNGYHPYFGSWMDGQSMQFYFLNSRQDVPEPWNTLTLEYDWFAAMQCSGSVFLELSTFLLMFYQPYRLIFPFLGAAFHGVIWYTLGVNYLTSVIIQFTLVLDDHDWNCLIRFLQQQLPTIQRLQEQWCVSSSLTAVLKIAPTETQTFNADHAVKIKNENLAIRNDTNKIQSSDNHSPSSNNPLITKPMPWAKVIVLLNPLVMMIVIMTQMEFWPLSNIPMYSGYRPRIGFNTTHIADMKYLQLLVAESAPHVWSRHWTNVVVHIIDTKDENYNATNTAIDKNQRGDNVSSYKMSFCVPSPKFHPLRGVKEFCLVPSQRQLDTERESNNKETRTYRLNPNHYDDNNNVITTTKNTMRVGGWNRQKPMVVMAEMLYRRNNTKSPANHGNQHTYCRHETLSPAQDFLLRNCAFLQSFPQYSSSNQKIRTELVVHLGTGEDFILGSVNCDESKEVYPIDRVPPCVQRPWN